MNQIFLPIINALAIALYNAKAGKTTTFGPSNQFMWVVGIIASTLFYAGLTGIPSLLSSPFWIIYTFFNTAVSDWTAYKNYIDNYT